MTVAVDKISDDDDAIAREDLRAVRSLDFARLSGTLARYVSVCLHSDLLLAVVVGFLGNLPAPPVLYRIERRK